MRAKKCKICKKEMLLCGFGRPTSMFGNARWECRNENCEKPKTMKQIYKEFQMKGFEPKLKETEVRS